LTDLGGYAKNATANARRTPGFEFLINAPCCRITDDGMDIRTHRKR